MRHSERAFNIALGLSVVSWAVLGLIASEPDALRSIVRWAIASLNLLVGLLLIFRQPVRTNGSLRLCAIALPGLITAGLAFKISPTPTHWPVHAQVVFVTGFLVAATSLAWLGRNFALLPAKRSLVTTGPYALVRHPAYTGELLMIAACALATHAVLPWLIPVAATALIYLRIHAEEELLSQDPTYRAYQLTTPGKILPRRVRRHNVPSHPMN